MLFRVSPSRTGERTATPEQLAIAHAGDLLPVTFLRVTVPICSPAILDVAIYIFVNALTTVSAVIFLYGPDTKLASIAIVHMDEMGASAAAAGMATMIVATALGAKLLQVVLDRVLFTRLQAWRKR